ncbi:MAG: SAM hydrolase/SAM-dependent halogenase family protein [Thermoanaerobaculia bacterium]
MPILTLLTDFGTRDYYVAAVKGVILREAPKAVIIDITHEVSPGDIEEASFLLAAVAGEFPVGTVHLAVVDPQVGGDRRILVARTPGALFVAPDNGLLSPWLDSADVFSVTAGDLVRAGPGATFHGRDRFAPLAAALLRSQPPEDLGEPVTDPITLDPRPPRREGTTVEGRVVHVDRFGNLISDIPEAWCPRGARVVSVAGRQVERWVTHYAALSPGQVGALIGSLGTVEVSVRDGSAAERLGCGRGDPVRVVPA